MPEPSTPGNSCALSQASENARVIVPSLQETSAEWRKCAGFLHLILSGNRIANPSSSALNPAIQGVLQQFNFWGNCLFWLVAVLAVVLLAVVLGFVHVAIASIGIAKILFFLFVLLFLVAVLGHVFRRS